MVALVIAYASRCAVGDREGCAGGGNGDSGSVLGAAGKQATKFQVMIVFLEWTRRQCPVPGTGDIGACLELQLSKSGKFQQKKKKLLTLFKTCSLVNSRKSITCV